MTAMVIEEAPRHAGPPPPLVAPLPVSLAQPSTSRLATATCRNSGLRPSTSGSPTPTATPGTRSRNGATPMSPSTATTFTSSPIRSHYGYTGQQEYGVSTPSFAFGYTPSPSESSDSPLSPPSPTEHALPQHPMMYSPPGQCMYMSSRRNDHTPVAPALSVPGSTAPRQRPVAPAPSAAFRRCSLSRSAFGATTTSSLSTPAELTAHFRAYLRILNQRLPSALGTYLAPRVSLNGRRMSAESFATSAVPPGGTLSAEFVVADVAKRLLAARIEIEIPSSPTASPTNSSPNLKADNLALDTSPPHNTHSSLSSPEEQRRGSGSSAEHVHSHVFYHFDEYWRIDEMWSVGEAGSGASPPIMERPPKCPRPPRRRPSVPSAFESYRI